VIVVTGTRTERPLAESAVSTDVIDREDIEASGAVSLDQVLRLEPGVQVVETNAGPGVRMRGLDPEHVLVLVDGQRVVGRNDGAIDLSRFSVSDIERIEIVRGPSSALYGSDALGGVINIVTRRPQSPLSMEARARAGTFRAVDAGGSVGLRGDRANARIGGSYYQRDGYDLDPDDEGTTGDSRRLFEVTPSVAASPVANLRLSGQGMYSQLRRDGIDDAETGAVFDRTSLTEQAMIAGGPSWTTEAPGRLSLTGAWSYYRDQYSLDQRGGDSQDTYQETIQQLSTLTAQYDHALGGHLLTVGAEGFLEVITSDRLGAGEADRQRAALFVQDEWSTPGEQLAVVPGARLDADSQFGVRPAPRLALRYDPIEQLILRAGVGAGFRAPAFKELYLLLDHSSYGYVVEGNPALGAETSRSVDAGVEVLLGRWRLAAEGYHNHVDGLIGIELLEEGDASNASRYTYTNVDEAITQGVDLRVGVVTDRLDLDVGSELARTGDLNRQRPLEGRPALRASAGVTTRQPRAGLSESVRLSWTGERPYYEGEADDLLEVAAPYTLLEARVAWEPGQRLTVDASGRNLLNARDDTYLTITPRTFLIGLTVRHPRGGEDSGDEQ